MKVKKKSNFRSDGDSSHYLNKSRSLFCYGSNYTLIYTFHLILFQKMMRKEMKFFFGFESTQFYVFSEQKERNLADVIPPFPKKYESSQKIIFFIW
jgi:hypothetical protein